MALPVSPAPKSDDIATRGWAGITVRIAWTLMLNGLKVRREVLDAARQHVMLHLQPSTPLPQAEDRAAHLTTQFIAMARDRHTPGPWAADAAMPLTDRWARAIEHVQDRVAQAVFRMHYGDRRSLAYVENKLQCDRVAVEAARGGLREVLRRVARQDDLPLDTWQPERLDRVLERLASWAPDHCPPMYDVINGAHRVHVRACPRCNRMVRLVNAGTLEASDLQAPSLHTRPRNTLDLMVVQLHPDSRQHLPHILDALGGKARAYGEQLLLIPGDEAPKAFQVLSMAAELGRPGRFHIRAAEVSGPGSWSHFGPLGPQLQLGIAEVHTRAWGSVGSYGVLPEPLPAPPSARTAWAMAGLLATTALFTAGFALAPTASERPTHHVQFVEASGGTWASFDVPDGETVALFSAPGGQLEPVLSGTDALEKATLATGDGTYRVQLAGRRALLVATTEPIEWEDLFANLDTTRDPLLLLSERVRRRVPDAAVFEHR